MGYDYEALRNGNEMDDCRKLMNDNPDSYMSVPMCYLRHGMVNFKK